MVEERIEEAYNVALNLGLKDVSDMERDVFKIMLRRIAISAIDEVRNEIGDLLHKKSYKYL